MRRVLPLLCVALLAGLLSGCGGDRDKGINKDRDKPREGPAEGK
jgi:hypothetical protein